MMSMGKIVDILFRDYKIVDVWRLSKKMFPDYLIEAKTDDDFGKTLSLAKAAELIDGKNSIFCSSEFEMDEPEKFLMNFSFQGRFPGVAYYKPYKSDIDTLRILANNSDFVSIKFFPDDFDWEKMKQTYNEALGKRSFVNDVSFYCGFPRFSFKITPETKDFGDDYLQQLEKNGYIIKYH